MSLYRVLWRWHFYAGLVVAPVLLVVATTGAIYIFRAEIEDAWHARLRFVAPGVTRLGEQAIVDRAAAVRTDLRPIALELRSEPDRAAIVRLGREPGKPGKPEATVYVDPYRGEVIGTTGGEDSDQLAAFFDVVLSIHRRLFAGTAGRLIVELTVGWTILLFVTGLCLWWPERPGKARGVWYPRLRRAKPYVVFRDLHAVAGFYLLAPMALIAATGLFYALIWGASFQFLTGSSAPKPGAAPPEMSPPGEPLPLDRLVTLARDRYPGRNLLVTLPGASDRVAKIGAANDFNNSYGPYVSAQFELDRADGRMTAHETLAENGLYWWHGWTYPLHVGSILGPATKVLWLAACLVLAALPITGLAMWWVRRPAGRTGFPRRPEVPLPRPLIALIALLGLLMPAVGGSMLAILAGEWAVARLRRARVAEPAQPVAN